MDTSYIAQVSQVVASLVQHGKASGAFDARFGTPPSPWRKTPIPGGGHSWVNQGLGLNVVATLSPGEDGRGDTFLVSVSTSSGRKVAPHQIDIVTRVFMARVGGVVAMSRKRSHSGMVITYMAGEIVPVEVMAN